jgi:hypothetical protein
MIQPIVKLEFYGEQFQKRVAAKRRRVLFKQGAYVRTTMQRSMRYSNKASKPGQPPHAHRRTGAHLRKGIRFVVDDESVICGPDLRSDSTSLKPLPQLLNEGGITTGLGGERIAIEPRPFIDPVFTDGGRNFRQLIEKEPL